MVSGVVVRQAGLRCHEPLVPGDGPIHAREVREALLDGFGEAAGKLVDVLDDSGDPLLVELNRPRHIVEHTKVVDDKAWPPLYKRFNPTDHLS